MKLVVGPESSDRRLAGEGETMLQAKLKVSLKRAGHAVGSLSLLVAVAVSATARLLFVAMGEPGEMFTVGANCPHCVVVSVTNAGADTLPRASATTTET